MNDAAQRRYAMAEAAARTYREALFVILAREGGCSRLVWPSECRQAVAGYPTAEWCNGCIAADAIGIPVRKQS